MKIYKNAQIISLAAILLFISTLLMSCAKQTTDDRAKERVVENYMRELFNIDVKLAMEYQLSNPTKVYPNDNFPTFYVDQKYFQQDVRLHKFINRNALAEIAAGSRAFSLPLWMELIVDNKQLGKVVGIKNVESIGIEHLDYATKPNDGCTVRVDTIVLLDTEKEQEVEFSFRVHLVKENTGSYKYTVDEAVFTPSPWLINIGGRGIATDWYLPDR